MRVSFGNGSFIHETFFDVQSIFILLHCLTAISSKNTLHYCYHKLYLNLIILAFTPKIEKMNLLTNLFYFILLFINPLTVYSHDVRFHNETEPGLKIYKVFAYKDGIAVVHLI